jgi:hypothetical protein
LPGHFHGFSAAQYFFAPSFFALEGHKSVFGEMKYYFMLFEMNKMILMKRDRFD